MMLAERFAERDDIEEIVCLDKNPITPELLALPKILYLRANTSDDTWQGIAAERKPDVVIHCAWQIREFYFRKKLHHAWNICGSRNVFAFALSCARHLIYLSSVAVYGAYSDNRVDRPFTEEDPMREDEYLYGVQKKQSEQDLYDICQKSLSPICATVLRICSVAGPRYKRAKKGFTLQNLLALLPFIPIANQEWGRQFVHEEDLMGIIDNVANEPPQSAHRVFNVAPPMYLRASEIVHAYGKRAFHVPKELVRLGFFVLRHLSLGRLPTSRGGWRFYVYPVAVDGGAIKGMLGNNFIQSILYNR